MTDKPISERGPPEDFPLEPYRPYLRLLARLRLETLHIKIRAKLDAEDIVQETMLKAHEARHQFAGHTEVEWRGFLRQILANTLADAVRRVTNGKRNAFQEQSPQAGVEQLSCQLETFAANHTSPSQQAQRAELLRLLDGALAALDPDERSALELRYLQAPPWSLADIARHLNRPSTKAVAGLLCRGLVKLRKLLGTYLGGEP
jgi:RNA polymerase sigma-70 factor (subfamily 1)